MRRLFTFSGMTGRHKLYLLLTQAHAVSPLHKSTLRSIFMLILRNHLFAHGLHRRPRVIPELSQEMAFNGREESVEHATALSSAQRVN